MTILQTFLISVTTALLTTLVVEYLAKPALEARKLRMIRNSEQIDEIIFGFQRLGLQLGSVPNRAPDGTLAQEVRSSPIADIAPIVEDLMRTLARLSPKYAQKHGTHISYCAHYLSLLQALSNREQAGFTLNDATVGRLGAELAEFDVYFRANTGFRDSNENALKRWRWRKFEKRVNEERLREIISKWGDH